MTNASAAVSQSHHLTRLARWTSLLGLGLLASTWPLWLGPVEFPQIPLSVSLVSVPLWFDWMGLAGLIGGLFGVLWGNPRTMSLAWLSVLLGGFTLVALDQHRLQPWLYQLLFISLIFLCSERRRIPHLLTWIVVSIYVYSALGKFDAEFLHTVGQLFWQGMLEILGRSQAGNGEVPIGWIALLPMTELLLAVGLACRPTRAVAGGFAMIFHLLLIVLLGPLGLNHSWGVVLWNLQFAGQAWILFVWPELNGRRVNTAAVATDRTLSDSAAHAVGTGSGLRQRMGNGLTTLVAAGVIALPVVERWGFWDHWTSWALYAPHSSRVEVWVAGTAVDRLPASLQQMMPAESAELLWIRLPLERWSLAETKTPIYPQARFQFGVAVELARRVQSDFLIKAIVRGVAARWDGRRQSREVVGSTAIEQTAERLFWLNVQPRSSDATSVPLLIDQVVDETTSPEPT